MRPLNYALWLKDKDSGKEERGPGAPHALKCEPEDGSSSEDEQKDSVSTGGSRVPFPGQHPNTSGDASSSSKRDREDYSSPARCALPSPNSAMSSKFTVMKGREDVEKADPTSWLYSSGGKGEVEKSVHITETVKKPVSRKLELLQQDSTNSLELSSQTCVSRKLQPREPT